MVSFLKHRGEKVNDDHDKNSGLEFICEQWGDTVYYGKSAFPEVAANALSSKAHVSTEETPTVEEFLQAQDTDHEGQGEVQ